MDYAVDYIFEASENMTLEPQPQPQPQPQLQLVPFVYNDTRLFSKMYVGLKLLGGIVYANTLTWCTGSSFYFYYMSMLVTMAISTANSARYEYCHYKRYGTSFYTAHEFQAWKMALLPKSRLVFSVVELVLKVGYFIFTFPPRFEFINRCTAGETIFKIHILGLTLIYTVSGIFSAGLLISIYCCRIGTPPLHPHPHPRHHVARHVAMIPIQFRASEYEHECCCICLEGASQSSLAWSMLVCGHKFHTACISNWLTSHKTCPICRFQG
jgi:hypothetical protein